MHLSGHILYSLDEFLSQPTRRVIVTERMMPSLTILQLKTENEQLCNIRQLNFPTTMLGPVYTAIRKFFKDRLSAVHCDDSLFTITARHGAWLSPLSEKIRIKIVATGTEACKVEIESSSRSFLNLIFGFGSNKENVKNLADAIQNQVYKLMTNGEIRLEEGKVKLKAPEIRMKNHQNQ